MAYIHTTDGIEGSCFHFLENGDSKRREVFLTRPVGKKVTGTLALQVFDDRNYKRITFADAKNVYSAAAKDVLGYLGMSQAKNLASLIFKGKKIASRNDLIHFDFDSDEISRGKKLIRFEIQITAFGMITMMCYDFDTYDGCAYLFPDKDVASGWAHAIGIRKAYLYDLNDKFDSFISL